MGGFPTKVDTTMTTLAITVTGPRSRPSILPLVALAVAGLLIAAGLLAYWRGRAVHAPIGYGAELPALLSTELFAATAVLVGSVIARRRSRCAVAWLLVLLGLAAAAVALGLYSSASAAGRGAGATLDPGGWLAGAGMQPLMGGLTGMLMFVFPDGRLPSRRWRPAVALLGAGAALRFAEVAFSGEPVPYLPTLANPHRLPDLLGDGLGAAHDLDLGLYLLLLGMAVATLSLVVRYRGADREARQQIRWFVFAGTVVAATLAPLAHLFVFVDPGAGRGQDLWVLFFVTASLFPAAVGAAILRYRLYAIDRIISRTFVYGMLTAILAGLFTASVGLSQRLFVALTGETSDAAIILTTLVAASSYTTVRRRLEALAERLFRYEEPRFGAYRQSLRDLLGLLDPEAAARRLVDEATRELRASEGWVELATDDEVTRPAAADGPDGIAAGHGPAVVSVEIPGRGGTLGRLALGARLDGTRYRPEEIRALGELAGLVGRVLDVRPARLPAPPPEPAAAPPAPAQAGAASAPQPAITTP
jgi:hypothetical protein